MDGTLYAADRLIGRCIGGFAAGIVVIVGAPIHIERARSRRLSCCALDLGCSRRRIGSHTGWPSTARTSAITAARWTGGKRRVPNRLSARRWCTRRTITLRPITTRAGGPINRRAVGARTEILIRARRALPKVRVLKSTWSSLRAFTLRWTISGRRGAIVAALPRGFVGSCLAGRQCCGRSRRPDVLGRSTRSLHGHGFRDRLRDWLRRERCRLSLGWLGLWRRGNRHHGWFRRLCGCGLSARSVLAGFGFGDLSRLLLTRLLDHPLAGSQLFRREVAITRRTCGSGGWGWCGKNTLFGRGRRSKISLRSRMRTRTFGLYDHRLGSTMAEALLHRACANRAAGSPGLKG